MRRFGVFSVLAMLVAVHSFAGLTYTAKTTAEGGRAAEAQNATVKAWVSGEKAKVVFEQSGNKMMAEGMYMITSDGGKTVYMVNPKEKTYYKWDIEAMMGFAGGAMKMVNMKFADPKVEKLGEEADGLVAGVPTIHYRFHTTYTMSMALMMIKKSSKVVKDEEIWAAPRLVEAALGIWLRKSPPKTGNDEFDAMMKAEMSKIQGFPLKHRTVQTSTDEKGRSETTTTVMEVTDLQMADVPASTFEIPAGYKETSMLGGEEGGEKGGANPFSKMFGGSKKNQENPD